MFETPTYHAVIKKVIVGFGTLFSNLQIPRTDESGSVRQTVSVPIAYAPKEKWAVRVDQEAELDTGVYTTLPRMGFEITGYSYDSSRKVNRNNKIACHKDGATQFMFSPVPYNLDISLYAQTKGTEDGLAIVEQILPIFTPEYNLNLNAIPEMNIQQDVPIVLNSISVQDDYEGDFQTRRFVTHTFSFTAKLMLYAPIQTGKVILNTDVDVDTKTLNYGEHKHNSVGNINTGNIDLDKWTFKA